MNSTALEQIIEHATSAETTLKKMYEERDKYINKESDNVRTGSYIADDDDTGDEINKIGVYKNSKQHNTDKLRLGVLCQDIVLEEAKHSKAIYALLIDVIETLVAPDGEEKFEYRILIDKHMRKEDIKDYTKRFRSQ